MFYAANNTRLELLFAVENLVEDQEHASLAVQPMNHDVETPRKPLIAFDVVLIATPLALIAKIVLCIVAARQDKDAIGSAIDQIHPITLYLVQFNSQLTTLFAIIFVTTISTLIRRVALWRAQRGASVAELEQWHASISVPSTLKTIWSLRMYTVTSVALMAIWSWYYLGSQASSREYKYQEAGDHIKINMTVTNPLGPSFVDQDHFPDLDKMQMFATNAQFTTLFAPGWGADSSGLTGYDGSGLPLIPLLGWESKEADRHGFFDAADPSESAFTSSVSVQMYGKFPGLDPIWTGHIIGTLSFNTSYLHTRCAPMQAKNTSEFPTGVQPQMTVLLNVSSPSNTSAQGPAMFEIWYRSDDNSTGVQAMSSVCNITTVPLQIKAQCTAQGCIVKKLKSIAITASASYQTPFNDETFAAQFYNALLWCTGSPSSRNDTTYTEQPGFPMTYPDTLPDGSSNDITEIDIITASLPQNIQAAATAHGLTIPEMYQSWISALESSAANRAGSISQILNMYLAMFQKNGYAYNTIMSSTDDFAAVFSGAVPSPWLNTASFHGAYWNPRYALSVTWLVIDFISCAVLLFAGVASVYLRTRILAPDIFGFVSSMTRDNPNVPLPHAASTLGGIERARMLKKMKVQIADVEANHEVGKVSLTRMNAHMEQPNTAKLSKQRKYM